MRCSRKKRRRRSRWSNGLRHEYEAVGAEPVEERRGQFGVPGFVEVDDAAHKEAAFLKKPLHLGIAEDVDVHVPNPSVIGEALIADLRFAHKGVEGRLERPELFNGVEEAVVEIMGVKNEKAGLPESPSHATGESLPVVLAPYESDRAEHAYRCVEAGVADESQVADVRSDKEAFAP